MEKLNTEGTVEAELVKAENKKFGIIFKKSFRKLKNDPYHTRDKLKLPGVILLSLDQEILKLPINSIKKRF